MSAITINLDGSPAHLVLPADDDIELRLTFTIDVSGWTDWFAQIRDKDDNTWDWTFDLTDVATGIVVMSLTKTQTAEMFGAPDLHWQFRVLDDDGLDHTLVSSDSRIVVKKNAAVR